MLQKPGTSLKGSSNITVAVIDDGVEGHEDLRNVLSGYTPRTNGNGSPRIVEVITDKLVRVLLPHFTITEE